MYVLLVFIGGGLGSVIRYLIGVGFQRTYLQLPVATLCANVLACVIFAVTVNLLAAKEHPNNWKFLILTGLCGGLSTFSTFGYETFLLLKQQNYFWMILNIVLSLTLCIGSFMLVKK
ncbi:MAG: Integral rane protein involved in chromosome condensation [Bacteroidetes bacterium]|jgi:CrcB protein|nr:Integral rane protein involved in chromosome condensation [Bacteroidota bacterium]